MNIPQGKIEILSDDGEWEELCETDNLGNQPEADDTSPRHTEIARKAKTPNPESWPKTSEIPRGRV